MRLNPIKFTVAAGLMTVLLSACASIESPAPLDSADLHKQVLTLDTHVDIPLTYMDEVDPGTDTDAQVDLGKMDVGGLDAAFFIVYTPQAETNEEGYAAALEIAETRYAAIDQLVTIYADRIELAKTSDDVRRIDGEGKRVALIGMENAFPIGEDLDSVSMWAERGVRYMGITHFGHNQFGDSSNPNPARDDGPRHNGLSEAGKELIKQMNDSGIMVVVSHAGKETMMQAADLSRTPIMASHSGVKAVGDSPRNLDDEQLRKIKEVGGVAHMVAFGTYLKPLNEAQIAFQKDLQKELGLETAQARAAMTTEQATEYRERIAGMFDIEPRASVADFVDHVDHAVIIAGIDHVGISSDFDGGGGIVGWKDATETANVTKELVKRGYSVGEIEKLWSGNLLRVLDAAQAAKIN